MYLLHYQYIYDHESNLICNLIMIKIQKNLNKIGENTKRTGRIFNEKWVISPLVPEMKYTYFYYYYEI